MPPPTISGTSIGTRVRFTWPDGTLAGAHGEIIHVSWRDDGTPGVLIRWQEGAQPRVTCVPEPSWLITEDGRPLEIPPRIVRVSVIGGVL